MTFKGAYYVSEGNKLSFSIIQTRRSSSHSCIDESVYKSDKNIWKSE